MRKFALAAFVFIALGFSSDLLGQGPKEPFTLMIVPNERHEKRAYLVFNKPHAPHEHFHVILTNVSDKPQRLWNDSCSWGYGRLYFEVTDRKGNVRHVKQVERIWEKNYPDWFYLSPRHHVIFDVSFDLEKWEGVPTLEKDVASAEMKMRAFYRLEDAVISSPEFRFTFFA
jgi:hypothetical protein